MSHVCIDSIVGLGVLSAGNMVGFYSLAIRAKVRISYDTPPFLLSPQSGS